MTLNELFTLYGCILYLTTHKICPDCGGEESKHGPQCIYYEATCITTEVIRYNIQMELNRRVR